jgi:hypothetical protein
METSRGGDPFSLPGGTEVGPWRVVSRSDRGDTDEAAEQGQR